MLGVPWMFTDTHDFCRIFWHGLNLKPIRLANLKPHQPATAITASQASQILRLSSALATFGPQGFSAFHCSLVAVKDQQGLTGLAWNPMGIPMGIPWLGDRSSNKHDFHWVDLMICSQETIGYIYICVFILMLEFWWVLQSLPSSKSVTSMDFSSIIFDSSASGCKWMILDELKLIPPIYDSFVFVVLPLISDHISYTLYLWNYIIPELLLLPTTNHYSQLLWHLSSNSRFPSTLVRLVTIPLPIFPSPTKPKGLLEAARAPGHRNH